MAQAGIHRPVRQLSVEVARKIAAGEVIDRPAAIVRELLDNAVDSGANQITVEINGGGIDKIRVSDNGYGMTRDDLMNCARPHCTSKIIEAADLMKLDTLGFRGEALASIAAVSRLSISSGTCRMTASIDTDHKIDVIPPVQNGKGTIVQSERLFENFPARRVFLKRPASETMMCRELFVEKSLPRTDIGFRLIIDGSLRYDLPADVSLSQRFVKALELKEQSSLFSELTANGTEADGKTKWSFKLVIGEPAVFRNDRKNIFIYVNGRRIQEYSLMQAIEYGCQGFFPNGAHPVAALFVQVDPSFVDFNIHPAKREVRFKDISSIHHGVSSTVKAYFRSYGLKTMNSPEQEDSSLEIQREFDLEVPKICKSNYSSSKKSYGRDSFFTPAAEKTEIQKLYEKDFYKAVAEPLDSRPEPQPEQEQEKNSAQNFLRNKFLSYEADALTNGYVINHNDTSQNLAAEALSDSSEAENPAEQNLQQQATRKEFRYIGSVLGVFLLAEMNGTLYIIDQHAAHERILFNKIMASGGEKQNLLIPYTIKTESKEEDAYLESIREVLANAGFTGENKGDGNWEFTTIPARWTGTQEEFQTALLETHTSPQEILYKIAAMTACKAAVKDGYELDSDKAAQLAKEALELKDPHCPHGRPVWTTFTKEQLFARVRRT